MTPEIMVRDYLRSCPGVTRLLNEDSKRLNVDWSGDLRATHVTISLAGGGLHPYLPIQQPALQLHIFGSTRPAAASLASEVALALQQVSEAHSPLASAEVLSINFAPTTDGVARYLITASVVAKLGLAA
jgi:hypothetical protein